MKMEPVRGSRIERKKEETKNKIITVAMDLFNRQGFDQTTVEQIAEEADVAKGTIYNHFPVKEAIIGEYIKRDVEKRKPEVIRELQELPDTRSRLAATFRKSLEWAEVGIKKDLFRKFYAYRMQTFERTVRDRSLKSGFHLALEYIISLGKENGEIRKDIPTEVLAMQLESLHNITLVRWLIIPEKYPVNESIDWNIDLFLNGAACRGEQE
jgi:AcrR family transcriptional regulator